MTPCVRDQGKDCEAQSDPRPHDDDHGKSRFEAARRGQDDQMLCQSGAVLQRMCQLSLLGRRKPSSIACWDTPQQRSPNDACRPENPSWGLAKPIHHARVPNRQRHIQASRQMANIPSFLVCADSEKHCFDTSPPHGDDARDGGGEFISKASPDKELGGHEKEIPAL